MSEGEARGRATGRRILSSDIVPCGVLRACKKNHPECGLVLAWFWVDAAAHQSALMVE